MKQNLNVNDYSFVSFLERNINSISNEIVTLRERINYVSVNRNSFDSSALINKMEDELFELENKKSSIVSKLNSLILNNSVNSVLH